MCRRRGENMGSRGEKGARSVAWPSTEADDSRLRLEGDVATRSNPRAATLTTTPGVHERVRADVSRACPAGDTISTISRLPS